jgi:hypothetical protein
MREDGEKERMEGEREGERDKVSMSSYLEDNMTTVGI